MTHTPTPTTEEALTILQKLPIEDQIVLMVYLTTSQPFLCEDPFFNDWVALHKSRPESELALHRLVKELKVPRYD